MGDISTNFSRYEFACSCGCGFEAVDVELLEVLEDLRAHFNVAVTINSGCRCDNHNKSIGGAKNSMHTKGIAADVVVSGADAQTVYNYLDTKYPDKYGIGLYSNPDRVHIDVRRSKARW